MPHRLVSALSLLAITGCTAPVGAIVAADRSDFFFDRPFPSDDARRDDGTLDLTNFPVPETAIAQTMVAGWTQMAGTAVTGFSPLGPITFRLAGPVNVDATYPGEPSDPIRLFSLDSDDRVPVRVRFVSSAPGDPFFSRNTLVVQPDPRHAMRSGERYAAVLDRSLARAPDGWTAPDGLTGDDRVGVATVFTVQDALGQLRTLGRATDDVLNADATYLDTDGLREVVSLSYAPGVTPSGRDATACVVVYADGSEQTTWTYVRANQETFTVDLTTGPTRVFETTLHTVSWRPLAELPYASPGVGFLSDFSRTDGVIAFAADGTLLATPEPEAMRVVIQVPRDTAPTGFFTWDHGTAGQAYSAVQPQPPERRLFDIRSAAADAGLVIVSRDQPLYGQRYPLIDDGFDASLGFYNIANLPAFRDNLRQAAVDHHVLNRFIRERLPALLAGEAGANTDTLDPQDLSAFGHSLGSITGHLGLMLEGGDGADRFFASGSGGFISHYVLDTGLLGTDNDVVGLLQGFIDVQLPPNPTGSEAIGALIGVPESGWDNVDDGHPLFMLFQTLMDGADPLAMPTAQPVPEHILMGIGDWQVPNITTEWLADALPNAERTDCTPLSDYDPHQCTFVEDEGVDTLTAWLAAH